MPGAAFAAERVRMRAKWIEEEEDEHEDEEEDDDLWGKHPSCCTD